MGSVNTQATTNPSPEGCFEILEVVHKKYYSVHGYIVKFQWSTSKQTSRPRWVSLRCASLQSCRSRFHTPGRSESSLHWPYSHTPWRWSLSARAAESSAIKSHFCIISHAFARGVVCHWSSFPKQSL